MKLEDELGYLTAKVEHLEQAMIDMRKEIRFLSKWTAKTMGFVAAMIFLTQLLAIYLKLRGRI